jgi:myo-inositol 2-dehydrogenase/D-chiro-inositol 1-dehydrogenase
MNRAGRTKVALIGAGGWGRQHARIFAARQDVDFCAVVGRTPERTRARVEEFGVSPYLDIQEMLDTERPDLVSLCLPSLGHFGPTLQVIEAGYPLLVEKPLFFDLREAETLLDEASRRGHRIVRVRRTRNHRLTRRLHDEFRGVQHGRRQLLPACSQHYRHSRASGNPLQQALVLILHLATSAPAHAGPPCPPSYLALHSRATGGRRWGS